MPTRLYTLLSDYAVKPLARLVGRFGTPTASPAYATTCAADSYDEDPTVAPLHGKLRPDARALARYVGQSSGDPVFALAQSPFLHTNVKLLGRYLGQATVSGDTRPVYGVSTCQDCLWAADYFNRASAATPGGDWEVLAGSADIASNKLVIDEDDALLRHRLTIPDSIIGASSVPVGSVTATVSSSTAGAHARIVGAWWTSTGENYIFADYEFQSGYGVLRLYSKVAGSSTPSLLRGPYHIPGKGTGQSVRIRLCWTGGTFQPTHVNVEIEAESGSWWQALSVPPSLLPPIAFGGKHGLGTGDVNGGSVTFDDYRVRFGSATIGKVHCPNCQACHACPDDQELCLHLAEDYPNPARTIILTRTGTTLVCGSVYDACGWTGQYHADGDNESANHYFKASLTQQSFNNVWVLKVQEFYPSNIGDDLINDWVYVFDAGELPDCSQWICLRLRQGLFCHSTWTPELFDYRPLAPAAISSGPYCPECYLPGFDNPDVPPCCDGVTLPDTIYVTCTCPPLPGGGVTDFPLQLQSQGSNGFEYQGEIDQFTFLTLFCLISQGQGFIWLFINSGTVEMPGTIHSCDPFHASGDNGGSCSWEAMT